MTSSYACITGIGLVTSLGSDVASCWRELLAGTIGLEMGAALKAEGLEAYPTGRARLEPALERLGMTSRALRRLDPVTIQALAATQEAVADAALETPVADGRVAVVVGTGIGGAKSYYKAAVHVFEGHPNRMSPFTIPGLMVNAPACNISLTYQTRGPAWSTSTACASGLDAIGIGLGLVKNEQADVVFIGGSEAIADDVGVGGMGAARALAKAKNGDLRVLRPFDKARAGTVVGEGSGMMVVESPEFAARRNAPVKALLCGYGAGSDGYHITQPRPDGSGALEVMRLALENGGLAPADLDVIYAHGTGTPLNDVMEGKAIRTLCGEPGPVVTSTKGQYGHTMGASGAINCVFAVKSILEKTVPPTVPCDDPDPECIITPLRGAPKKMEVRALLVNAFGFGGHNASISMRRP